MFEVSEKWKSQISYIFVVAYQNWSHGDRMEVEFDFVVYIVKQSINAL